MSDRVQRMVQELDELKVKLLSLRDFINHNPTYQSLNAEEKKYLTDQEYHMSEYHRVLSRSVELATRGTAAH